MGLTVACYGVRIVLLCIAVQLSRAVPCGVLTSPDLA